MKKFFCIFMGLVSAFLFDALYLIQEWSMELSIGLGQDQGELPMTERVYPRKSVISSIRAQDIISPANFGYDQTLRLLAEDKPNPCSKEKLNRSIPVFELNCCSVNAFASQGETQYIDDFLRRLNNSFTDQKLPVYEFAFMIYNAAPCTTGIPNFILSYMRSEDNILDLYHGAPESWMGI